MDVNKVAIGNFSIGAKNAGAKEKQENNAPSVSVNSDSKSLNVSPDVVFGGLENAAMQNIAMIVNSGAKEVDPAKYLSPERIADIEAMMGEFENGVGVVEGAIESELPGFFAADAKKALAAKIFAQE